jgi:hypothetical protein
MRSVVSPAADPATARKSRQHNVEIVRIWPPYTIQIELVSPRAQAGEQFLNLVLTGRMISI